MSFGEHHIAFGGNGTQQMSTHTPHTNLQAGIWLLIKCTWLSNNQQVWATQKKKFGCLLIWIIQVCLNGTAIFPNVPTNSSQITMIRKTAKKRRKLPTGKQVLSLIKCTWLIDYQQVWAVLWKQTFGQFTGMQHSGNRGLFYRPGHLEVIESTMNLSVKVF